MGAKKKTHEEFVKEVYDLVGDEYTIWGTYININTHIDIKHNKCGHIYSVQPANFLSGTRCPICTKQENNNKLRKTYKQFMDDVYTLVGNEYTVLGDYINSKTSIEIRHNRCGHIYQVRPSNFLSGKRCPACAKEDGIKKRTKSHKQFVEEVFNLVGTEYKVLGVYKNNSTPIKIKHTICGHIYSIVPNYFLGGNRCSVCAKENTAQKLSKTHKQFIEEVFNLVGAEYEVLGTYINTHTPVEIKHTICGHIYQVRPSKFIKGNRCPECARNRKRTHEEFKEDVHSLFDNEYEVIGTYTNVKTKIEMKHNECGQIYLAIPRKVLNGQGCPHCSKKVSKGEKKIVKVLSSWGIECTSPGYNKFDDCVNEKGNKLPFDILPLVYKLILIEYDGIQHSEPTTFGGISQERAEENFKVTQKHDAIKDAYCEKKGIPLLRIKHYQFKNIEKLLREFLIENDILDANSNLILKPAV